LFFAVLYLEFFMSFFKNLASNKRGATAIEYAIIAGLIAVVSVTGFTAVGTGINAKVAEAKTALD
jgi:pilus assembly protein Flp/PilA